MARAVKGATIGFIGEGDVSKRSVNALLADEMEAADDNLRFILPITKSHWTDGIQFVADFARKHEVPYEVVTDESTAKLKDVDTYLEDAAKTHGKVQKVPHKIVSVLEDAKLPGKLFVLWNDDEDQAAVAFAKATDADIKTFDLCSGLDPVTYEEDEAEADDEEEAVTGQDEAKAAVTNFVFTREQLEEKDLDDLKAIAAGRDIELPPRVRTPRYIEAILQWQTDNAPEGVDPETGEVDDERPKTRRSTRSAEVEEEDDDVPPIPVDEDDVEVSQGKKGETARASVEDDEYPTHVGNCPKCGGPIFALGSQPLVKRFCPDACEFG